jgi:type VI protein secretion system component VasK
MNRERIRSILGVWMPMVVGLWIIVTAIIFYFTADLTATGPFRQNLESWRLVCSAGVFFLGGLLLLSTFGRFQKSRAAVVETRSTQPAPAAPAEPTDEHPKIVK